MPSRSKRVCTYPGCLKLRASSGSLRCQSHQHTYTHRHHSSGLTRTQRGYNYRWYKLTHQWIKEDRSRLFCADPFNVHGGRLVPRQVTDHITPHRGDMELFWDVGNWQSLCKVCHDRKTAVGQ